MAKSLSLTSGIGNIRHNVDIEYRNSLINIDPARSQYNTEIMNDDIEDVYEKYFGEAVDKYNAKQKRSDRKIDNYLDKISSTKNKKSSYEYVVMIGNKDTNSALESENREISSSVYKEFLEEFKKKFPQLKVFHAVIHNDESTPHMHFDYIPVASGYKQGLETQASLSKALEKMGVVGDNGKGDVRELNKKAFQLFQDVALKHGIERLDMGCNRSHLDLRDFKEHVKEIESPEYAYTNDPALVKALSIVEGKLEQALELSEKQNQIIEKVSNAGIFDLKSTVEECKQASKELFPKFNILKTDIKQIKSIIQEIPVKLRDYILNPAKPEKIIQPSLGDVVKESKKASVEINKSPQKTINAPTYNKTYNNDNER